MSQLTHTEISLIFTKLAPKLFKYSFNLARNKDDADDLVMEVITKALERFNETREFPENLEAYLIRSIRNLFINKIKVSKKTDLVSDIQDFEKKSGFSDIFISSETVPSDPLMRGKISKAYEKLSSSCREILMLIAHGHKYSEIKDITGKPYNTVAGTVFKCREKFHDFLYDKEKGFLS